MLSQVSRGMQMNVRGDDDDNNLEDDEAYDNQRAFGGTSNWPQGR